jgi:hypothetical protein
LAANSSIPSTSRLASYSASAVYPLNINDTNPVGWHNRKKRRAETPQVVDFISIDHKKNYKNNNNNFYYFKYY